MIDFARHMEAAARILLGEPNKQLSNGKKLRYGTHGSLSVDLEKGVWKDFETDEGGGVLDLLKREKGLANGAAVDWLRENGIHLDEERLGAAKRQKQGRGRVVATYDYVDEHGEVLFQVVRYEPKRFSQRRPDGKGGWIWSLGNVRRVLYRMPELRDADPAEPVFVVEGEKKVEALRALGLVATCNPGGAEKWVKVDPAVRKVLSGRPIMILADNDDPGRRHLAQIIRDLHGKAASIGVLELPGLAEKGDVINWLDTGGTVEELRRLADAAPEVQPEPELEAGVGDDKPTILVTPELGNEPVRQAAALLRDKVFIRCRTAVILTHAAELSSSRPVKDDLHPDDDPASIEHRGVRYSPETLFMSRLDATGVEMELADRALFQKLNAKGKPVDQHCPEVVSKRMVARATELGFLPIMGMAAVPLFLDGAVVQGTGYHAATGVYRCWAGPPPEVPDRPTDADVAAATAECLAPFAGFELPEEGKLAAVLTAVLRPGLETAPGIVLDANQPRVGKGKFARVVGTVGAGYRRWASVPDGHSQEEFEKRVDAAVIGGAPVVILDNLHSALRSPTLESILTEGFADLRRYGKNDESIRADQRSTFVVTLNQARISKDMLGRIIPLRLVVLDEKPHLRPFSFDPVAVARARRDEIIRACLIIARAWWVAGGLCDPKRREKLPVLGSFEDWSHLVAGAVEWLTGKSPIDLTVQRQEADKEENEAGELVEALARVFKDQEFTAADVVAQECSVGLPLINTVVVPKGAETMMAAIGQWLARNLETPRQGFILVKRNPKKSRYVVVSNKPMA